MSKQKRDYVLFIEDILESIKKIEKYTKDLSFGKFSKQEMVIDAVVRNFEIIGEAITSMPLRIQEKHPKVEWKEARGFRNILIHEYFGVDVEAIWDTINKDLPLLKKHISDVLKKEK